LLKYKLYLPKPLHRKCAWGTPERCPSNWSVPRNTVENRWFGPSCWQ